MSIDLKRVRVKGLFNTFELDVPIEKNTLILVGENGSGKSTLINLIYYALTAQWGRLIELPFQTCIITIGDTDYPIEKKRMPISKKSGVLTYFEQRLSKNDLNALLKSLAENSFQYWFSKKGRDKAKELRTTFSLSPQSFPLDAIVDLAQQVSLFTKQHLVGTKALDKVLNSNEKEQVLFLPTYRRIEKELSDVLPNLNVEETLSSYTNSRKSRQQAAYIELVEFGMTDVARAFKFALTDLDQHFRSELNRFTGFHLHDILQGLHRNVDTSQLATDEVAGTVDLMLSRIGEEILSKDDRQKLRDLVNKVRSDQDLDVEQSISALFLISLVGLHKNQQEREIPIRNLVELVNKYLSNKHLEFNPTAFELAIQRTDTSNSCEVPLHGLSSGEKQIVSLFSHVFLSGYQEYFVVIDEPELSISVPWQRRFLQDLKETGKCSGLIAVTHSPFVFENSLAEYAHSISEFVRES
jgi:ABC-type Mn2+/Zn2+ transport system ATPase subunit